MHLEKFSGVGYQGALDLLESAKNSQLKCLNKTKIGTHTVFKGILHDKN